MTAIRLLALLMLVAAASAAGGELRGTVRDSTGGEPLPGANVVVEGTLRGASTGRNGQYAVAGLPGGAYDVTVSLVGYRRVTLRTEVPEDGVRTLDVRLSSSPLQGEPVVVTAARRRQPLEEAPVSVAVMDATAIAARNTRTVDEALRYVPGVTITEAQVSVRGSSGYARGVGSRVLLLLDGIPFLTGDTGEINFETIPIGEVERIEVVKGASSALYGSSALGGVINVITREAPAEPETRVRLFAGLFSEPAYKQWEWTDEPRAQDGQMIGHAQRFGDLGLRLYASRMASDSYRQNDARRRYNAYARGDLQLDTRQDLTLVVNLLHQERYNFLYWVGLDRALVPPDAQQGDRITSTRYNISGQYRNVLADDLLLTARGMWFRNTFSSDVGASLDQSTSGVLRAEAQATWAFAPRHTLVAGIDGELTDVSSDIFSTRTGTGLAVYAQDEFHALDGLTVTAGLRYDHRDLDSLEADAQLSPKLGALWHPLPGTWLRLSYGRGFRAPSAAEAFIRTDAGGFPIVPNPSLRPERSTSYEAGVSQLLGDAAGVDLALFRSEFRDLIEAGFVEGTTIGTFQNVTDARVQGVELNVQAAFFERFLRLSAGWTYVDPVDTETGEVLKYRPRHQVTMGATARLGPVTLGADYRYLSRVERIDDEFVALGLIPDGDARVAVALLDLRGEMDFRAFGAPVRAGIVLTNLLRYGYTEIPGNLGPPRYAELVLEGVF